MKLRSESWMCGLLWTVGMGMWVFALVGLFWSLSVKAEGTVYNTVHTPSRLWTCTLPTARTDGTPLAVEELASVEYYLSDTPVEAGGASPLMVKTLDPAAPSCEQEVDFLSLPLGQHYLWAKAVDTEGRTSVGSTPVPFELTRVVAPPNAPTGGGFVDGAAP